MRISVVTVCRNAAATIGRSLESFFAQDYADKELVVVDGKSTDGTMDVVRSFVAGGDVVVISEPDTGIYQAMNKGLAAFRGAAVGFLNADDCFRGRGALSALAEGLQKADIVYGDLDIVRRAGQVARRWRSTTWRRGQFGQGWMPAHPTFYCRRCVVEQTGGFDLRYSLAADYDFMLRALELGGFSSVRIPRVLVDMASGGRSSSGLKAFIRHNMEALDSRRRWLGAGPVDYALFAKPLRKTTQLFPALSWRGGA